LSATFTPTNTTDYSTATATVPLTVNDATPVITWPAPSAITYGTALSATQLDATASVAGTFVYTPAAGTVLAAGSQTLSVTFTPTNTTDYSTATATVTLMVNKSVPVITWTAPSAITYGTALSATQLDATASVAGTFVYTPPAGTVLGGGTQALSVTFTPTNTTDYTTATAAVSLTVNDAIPVITWPTPSAITYGTSLSATQLDATASVAGTFVYTPAAGTVLAAGSQTLLVTFTPTNTADYTTSTATVALTVNKATSVLTWPAPTAIIYGTALSATQLNATASVPGTFVYAPPAGTVLAAGSQTLSVTFTPTNTTDYSTATATVTLTVQPLASPTIVATASPVPNAAGWNDSNVTVTFTCTAGSYPIKTCPAPIVVSTQGANQIISGTATDTSGNTASASVTVNLDTTPPTITATASPAPNAAGWNTTSVTVTFSCADALSGMAICPASQSITTAGANQIVKGTATDVAGNTASTQITLNISNTAPTITPMVTPAPNAAGWNNSPVTVSFICTPGGAPIATCPSPTVVTTQGSNIPVTGTVIDAAGATATASVLIKLDSTPPTVVANLSPTPNSSGWETAPVTVSFTCSDSLSGVATCPSPATISTDGAVQPVSGTATDIAGNSATTSVAVNLEQALPSISASLSPVPNPAGWNDTSTTVTFTCTKSVSSIVSCGPTQTDSNQGIGQVITGTVLDQAGNQATSTVTLNIDETPPVITLFTAPTQLSPGQAGNASLAVTDIAPIASVVYELNGSPIGTSATPPYNITVTAPSNATSGSTLTLTAIVTDIAGNTASANKGIQVASSGVVVGEVLSDPTGLPLQGATVQVIGQASQTATSDSQGGYSIPVTSSQLFLTVSEPGTSGGAPSMVTIERQVAVQSGVGTVPVDVRMTPLAAAAQITAAGGTVGTGAITITVPAGGATTSYYLTPLSQQGLPNLLPLGWSPVAAFDLQTNISTSAALSANFTGLPSGPLYLAAYSYSVHTWNMVTPNLSPSSGALTVSIPSVGDYALVVPDAGNSGIQIPAVAQPLVGVSMVTLPTSATSSGSLSPANIAPTGGTSMASLGVQSSTSLPSGTVIQSQVTETYTLTSGQLLSEEPRYEDILLYQNPAPSSGAVGATFPVTPSQTFQPSQLTSGDVHLNILSGRESVRGATGGSDPVSVQSGDATLTVAAGSLSQDTAVAVTPETLDTFLPSTSVLVPLSEYNVNFSGQVLTNAAQLSVGTQGAAPGTNVVIVQEQRIAGVPYLVVVSMATVTATNIVSQSTPGLPGVTQGGDYVFYELNIPTGFVSGTVSASSGPVAAMVQTDALPFVTFSSASGAYDIVAAAGTVNLTASVANTALAGTASAQVTAGQTATANLTLAGQVESVTITPANGAVGIPLTPEIDITAAAGFNPSTVTASSAVLTAAGSSTPIALQFVYSAGNTKLAVFTQAALQPSTQYTFQANGIANAVGGLISVPTITFTTAAIVAPTYNMNALVFAMPDSNGNVAISAAAGSFPAGSTILIVDQTNGVVYSLTVFNDGSVTGSMPATINDLLQITFTDPSGNVTSFTRSQFVASNGATAIGPGGGTVTGPNGTGLIVPAGAVNSGVTFQLSTFEQSAFPDMPDVDNLQFGSGLSIQTTGTTTQFNQEIKLVFPVPAGAAGGAEYYVYRRVVFPDSTIGYEVIDEAKVQGSGSSAQVVTASYPFPGYSYIWGALDNFYLTYFVQPLQNVFTQGAITGKVLGSSYTAGSPTPVSTPIAGAQVWSNKPGVEDYTTRQPVFATSQQGTGVYTLWDPNFTGGNVTVYANNIPGNFLPSGSSGSTVFSTSAYEIPSTSSLWTLFENTLLGQYRNVATGDITVPPPSPPQPPAAFNVTVVSQDGNGNRTPTSGVVAAGTSLVIGVSATLGSAQGVAVVGTTVSVNGQTLTVSNDPQSQYSVIASYLAAETGVFTIQVSVANAFGGPPATVSNTFLVIGSGGSVNGVTTGIAPMVLTAGSYPTSGTTQVPVNVSPSIAFSEPVTIPAGSVTFTDSSSNPIPMIIAGVGSNNQVYPNIAKAPASTAYTSITLEPLQPLRYSSSAYDPNGTYSITLSSAIQDQNQPPLSLTSTNILFYTFQLQTISAGNSSYNSPGIFVARNRAYLTQSPSQGYGYLWQFDVSNPAKPAPIQESNGGIIEGRVDYVTGQDNSAVVSGDTLIAVAQAPYPTNAGGGFQCSNVYLYRGTSAAIPTLSGQQEGDTLKWIGGVSLTQGATDGIVNAIAINGTLLYAATDRKGIQVVDLNQTVTDFNNTLLSATVYYDLNTEGQGFAQDAVIATIGVQSDPTLEYLDDLRDIKAATYTINGGSPQTYAVATGWVPSAVGSPIGVSFVVADPSGQAIVSKTEPQSSAGSLTNGVSLALGTIQTTSTSQNIAVVVGTGTPSSCSGCSTLVVMDMTNAASPVPLSFTALSDVAMSVVLNGNSAIVGYASDTAQVFDLTNPSAPVSMALLSNIGGSLYVYNGGVLFSSGAIPGSPTSALGGVHAAALGIIGVVSPIPPILSVNQNLASPNGSRTTLVPATVSVAVYPVGIQIQNPTLTFVGANAATQSVTINPATGTGAVQLPANLQVPSQSFTATFSFTSGGKVYTANQVISTGTVNLVVDSNNDTVLDPVADPAAAQSGQKFSFWQADPNNIGNSGQDGLLDYAPLRVYVGAVPPANTGSIQVALVSTDNNTASWVLTKNVGVPDGSTDTVAAANEKLYLTDQPTATNELNNTWSASSNAPAPLPCGAAGGNSFETTLCASQSGQVELPNISAGSMYDMLISCLTCVQDSTWALQSLYVDPNGNKTVLWQVPVDIRPIQNWMTIETVRNGSDTKPLSYPILDSGGWMDIPTTAQNLVLLVHGFDNSDSEVTSAETSLLGVTTGEGFFPAWFKRLYWAGHPVLLAQNNTQTVALSWPSNPGSTEYPIAYMTAFESGIPLAKFLSNQTLLYGRKIQAMAHSLGNVVVNSALSRPEYAGAQVTTYLMNEAALPAEAFNANYQPDAGDLAIFDSHAVSYGWSDNTAQTPLDNMWALQWAAILAGQPEIPCDGGTELCPDPSYLNKWNATLSASTYVTSPQPLYSTRWGQQRPSGTVPDSAPFNSTPQRGSWLGFFAGNLSQTNVVNSYNSGDGILGQTWVTMNLLQQPYYSFLGLGSDNATTQFWAALVSTDGGQETVWGQACSSYANCLHSNIIRQWAELSFWFPSRSAATGNGPIAGTTSLNFTGYAPPPPSSGAALEFSSGTHSYLQLSPFPAVFPAWQQVQGALQ
jgi:hypothetical protein